jgi:hypothetical protein
VKGTPNKATQDVHERLAQLGCDPIKGMAILTMDPSNTPELRGRMFSELTQDVTLKRKAVEIAAEAGTLTGFVVYGVPESEGMAT